MALLSLSQELVLIEAGNYVLTPSKFVYGIAALAQKWRTVILNAEFGGKQSHKTGPWSLKCGLGLHCLLACLSFLHCGFPQVISSSTPILPVIGAECAVRCNEILRS